MPLSLFLSISLSSSLSLCTYICVCVSVCVCACMCACVRVFQRPCAVCLLHFCPHPGFVSHVSPLGRHMRPPVCVGVCVCVGRCCPRACVRVFGCVCMCAQVCVCSDLCTVWPTVAYGHVTVAEASNAAHARARQGARERGGGGGIKICSPPTPGT